MSLTEPDYKALLARFLEERPGWSVSYQEDGTPVVGRLCFEFFTSWLLTCRPRAATRSPAGSGSILT